MTTMTNNDSNTLMRRRRPVSASEDDDEDSSRVVPKYNDDDDDDDVMPTSQQEAVFIEMKVRQLYRDRGGAQRQRRHLLHFMFVFGDVMFSLIFSPKNTYVWSEGANLTATLQLNAPYWYWKTLVYPILVLLSFDYFAHKRYFVSYAMILIYIPFVGHLFNYVGTDYWEIQTFVPYGLAIVIGQCIMLVVAILRNAIYPKWIKSQCFHQRFQAQRFWGLRQEVVVVDDSNKSNSSDAAASCLLNNWTLRYSRNMGCKQHMCQYQGTLSCESGLPHGIGQWMDDCPTGESLTGRWHHGRPVAPFGSRVQNSGDAVRAIAILYVQASDDDSSLKTNKAFPTNVGACRMGVASIECSVQGTFYKHLPRVTTNLVVLLDDDDDDDDDDKPIVIRHTGIIENEESSTIMTMAEALQTCFPYLSSLEELLSSSSETRTTNNHNNKNKNNHYHDTAITIKSNDPRGLQVEGYIHEATGYTYVHHDVYETNQVVVNVIPRPPATHWNNEDDDHHHYHHHLTATSSYPRSGGGGGEETTTTTCSSPPIVRRPGLTSPYASTTSLSNRSLRTMRRDGRPAMPMPQKKNSFFFGKSSKIFKLFHQDTTTTTTSSSSIRHVMSRDRSVMTEEEDGNSSERYYDAKEYDEQHHYRSEAFCANLEVEGWIPASQKEALVLLTGFSNTVDISFQSFGQLLSMTNICDSVYPIIFGWPAGTILTYRYASLAANTDENQRKFLHLIQGLQQTGIRKVHFLTHSMGVQTLLHAFSSSSSGERGPVSRCFQLVDPVFGTDDDNNNDNDQQQQLLICKSITLLNPDFPLEAFVNHAFRSIRCICNQITVVGNRKDQALLLSSFINGLFHWMGYRIPPTLRSNHHHNQDGNGGRSSSSLHTKTGFHLERRLGQELDSIHFLPPPADEKKKKKKKTAKDDVETGKEDTTINSSSYIPPPLLFQGEPEPVVIRLANDDNDDNDNDHSGIINNNKQWLDVDVIDTTNLDLDNVRHGGYNTNPILLKDLEDIIVTGRRAKDRPSLLFREGNVYSYCHAPSFLTM